MIPRPCKIAALLLAFPLTQAWAPTGFRATLWAPTARTAEDRRASLSRQRGYVAAASPVVDFDQEIVGGPVAAEGGAEEEAAVPVAATCKLGDAGLSVEATEVLQTHGTHTHSIRRDTLILEDNDRKYISSAWRRILRLKNVPRRRCSRR
jgi:hypothetical protein